MNVNLLSMAILIISITSCLQPTRNNEKSNNIVEILSMDTIQIEIKGVGSSNKFSAIGKKTDPNSLISNFDSTMLIVDCEKCRGEYVKELKMNLKNESTVDTTKVIMFLCTIDDKCKSHAEFSQFSNAVLFLLLEKEPELTIDLLSRYKFQLDYILYMISQPINDGIDLNKVADGLMNVNKKIELRDSILNAIPEN